MDDHPSDEAASIEPPKPVARGSRLHAALRDPVVWILLLAGIFDGISGNAIHSILLFSVALVIAVDVHAGTTPSAGNRWAEGIRAPDTRLRTAIVTGAAVYALLVGGFARYSWPATLAVVTVAAAGLALGWRTPAAPGELEPINLRGAIAWVSVFVALSLWELIALLLQPSLTTDSYAHPTLSVLTDPVIGTHPGRSITLFLWLMFGWFLMQR